MLDAVNMFVDVEAVDWVLVAKQIFIDNIVNNCCF
jgi:hypothetical protein